MQKYYKLLSQEMTSLNNTKWEIGKTITISKQGDVMCTDQVLHCYNHPMLAVIFNPIHANISNAKLFEISVDSIVNNDGLKFASKSQTLLREISLPEISLEQKIEFAIKVSKLVYKNKKWNLWADKWLDGSDRAASYAAYYASYAAYSARAAYYASYAAYSARAAAYAAYYAAYYAGKREEFNQKMINIVEEIVG
jgi:hypothetical protein